MVMDGASSEGRSQWDNTWMEVGAVKGGVFHLNQLVKHLLLTLAVTQTQRGMGGCLQTSVGAWWGPAKVDLHV